MTPIVWILAIVLLYVTYANWGTVVGTTAIISNDITGISIESIFWPAVFVTMMFLIVKYRKIIGKAGQIVTGKICHKIPTED